MGLEVIYVVRHGVSSFRALDFMHLTARIGSFKDPGRGLSAKYRPGVLMSA